MSVGNNRWLFFITNGVWCQGIFSRSERLRPRTKKREIGEHSRAVKRLRESLGQTQQQFAHTLNTSITTIARYETGRAPQGWFLARLAEVAGQNNLTDLATFFRASLVKELGEWDTTGYTLAIEPKDDVERLYVAAVLSVLRNDQFTRLIPRLNGFLSEVAKMSIEKLDWHKKNREAQRLTREMAKAGNTPDEIASRVGVPVEEVRQFLSWFRLEEHFKGLAAAPKP